MRRAAKVDVNHGETKTAFKRLGFTVLDLARVGSGCPDLLIARAHKTALVEVKHKRGKLSEGQKRFRDSWNGLVFECRSLADVIEIAGHLADVPR